MRPKLITRSLAAVLCSVMMLSQVGTSMSVLAAEEPVSETPLENESSETASSSHVVYGWNEESLTLHYETGYAPAWEALSNVLPKSVSANTDEGVVDVAIKGWTYNESYDVNKTGTYLIESVIDEKYALAEGVSNYPAYVVIEDVQHLVSFSGLDDIIAAPGSNVDVLDGVVATDGDIEYTVGIAAVTAVDGSGEAVDEAEIDLGEEDPVLFDVVDGYTYTVHLVAFDESGELTDAEPAVRYVYVRNIVQPRAPSLKKAPLLGSASSAITSIDQFSVDFASGATLDTASDSTQAYIWTATRSSSGHQFIYRVSYATSGIGDAAAGDIEIRVPLHLYKDRDGRYADKIELGVPLDTEVDEDSPDSRDVEFVYRVEGTEAVIYNRIPVSAASNGYVEIAYALSKNTFSYRDMSHSDEMTASIKAGSNTADDTELPYGINTTAKVNRTEKSFPTCIQRGCRDGETLLRTLRIITICAGKSGQQ